MARQQKPLGQVQLEVLQYINDNHPIPVSDVAEHFAETAGKARTTILTVMERLREKGYLVRRKRKGAWHYSPKHEQGEVLSNVMRQFVAKTLGGSVSPMIAYLAESDGLSAGELASLKSVVRELERRSREDKA